MSRADGMHAAAAAAVTRKRLARAQNRTPKREIPLEERIARCPQAVRDHIRDLRAQVRFLEEEVDAMGDQFSNAEHPGSDTVMQGNGSETPDRTLPPGSVIEFGGRFTVTWNLAELLSGNDLRIATARPSLVIEGMAPLAVVPLDHEHLLIREAEK